VILVPEAEPLVGRFRRQFDVSAQAGLDAHITVLFPFLVPERLGPDVLTKLACLFASQPPFAYELCDVDRFPSVLYLAPRPATPFAQLTHQVTSAFPECPPYGGAFAKPLPHLTVATTPPAQDLEDVDRQFRQDAQGALPTSCTARDVALVAKQAGRWSVVSRLLLGVD
jgi:2'-5' RNA ligase